MTRLIGNVTDFYIIRHNAYNSLDSTNYTLTLPTSAGNVTIPQNGGSLTLNGRDSKIHVTDYDLGGTNLLYSSAEIFTWKSDSSKTVLVVYGGAGETHELAIQAAGANVIEGSGVTITNGTNNTVVLNYDVTPDRNVVQVGDNLFVYLLCKC